MAATKGVCTLGIDWWTTPKVQISPMLLNRISSSSGEVHLEQAMRLPTYTAPQDLHLLPHR